ncbi:MAG: putative heme transporter, partial [Acidimicrobiaceae bacterium]|nr:putative heme transporter [Acidimicrobiaceae bacterium]
RSRLVVRIVLALLILIAVYSQRRSLLSATDRLGRLSPAWLALAVAAEILSFVAAAELQHHLLVGTGARVDRLSLLALTYAGTAMSFTLPAGPAVSGRYMYRTLVRRGSSGGAAAWVLAATAVLSLVSLVLLGLVGAQIRGLGVVCSAIGAGVGVSILVIAAGLVWALVWSSRHQRRVEMLALSVAGWWSTPRRIMGHWLGRPDRAAYTELGGRIQLAVGDDEPRDALGAARLGAALALAGANWLADLAALAVAFAALGLAVPWQGLLLAYAVTQLVTTIPLLPGSIGLAEGSMAAALVCSGVHPTEAVAGVLVYRLVSFWLVLPTGWLAWTFLRRHGGRLDEATDCLSVRSAVTAD